METSQCWPSFTIFSTLLFQISISRGSTVNSHDDDCFVYQRCGETSASLLVYEQNFTPTLKNNGLIQSRDGNSPESLTWTTEVPKVMKSSETENFLDPERCGLDNSKENLTCKNSRKNFVRNFIAPGLQFLSKSRLETTQIPQEVNNSLNRLAKTTTLLSKYNPTRNALLPQCPTISRSKREAAHKTLGKVNTLFGLKTSEEVFNADQSLEALLKNIIKDHIYGCDLIIVYDHIYRKTRTLESLVRIPFTKQVLQLVFVEDLSDLIKWPSQNCQGTMILVSKPDILIDFGGINKFLWAYKAKVIIVGLQLNSLEKFLKTVKGKKTEHVIGVVKDPINKNFEVYTNLLFWGVGMKLMTDWSNNTFSRRTNLFPDKVNDLRNAQINALIFEFRPMSFYDYAPNGTILRRHGRFLTMVRTLAEKFNFTLNFIETEHAYGYRIENGTFVGLPGQMGRDEGHFGLPFFYSSAQEGRYEEHDYSHYMEDDKLCFLVPREAPIPPWQSLGLPFTPESWIAVISGIILSGPIFYLFVLASTITGDEYENFKSLAYSTLFTVGIQIDHPLVSMPKRMCNQIFIVFLLVYSLILSTGYRSNLISFLTVARPPKQINTFKDLAESGLRIYGLDWVIPALNNSGDPYLKKLLERFEVRFSIEDFIDEFMEGKGAAANSRSILEGRITSMSTKSGKPVTRFLKDCVRTYMGTIIYQWHSPLNPGFNRVIGNLVATGIAKHWILESYEEYRKFVKREGSVTYYPDVWRDYKDDLIPLSIDHLTGIWASLVIGYFLATVSFAVEVIGYKEVPSPNRRV